MSTRPATRPGAVRPSARDPVERWLDVFIPMTGLPRSRAEEIRAELEDHLRARVADLMITGVTETEAVQRAVGELGETAALARGFRTALKPRRHIVIHTALITTAGLAVAFGVYSANRPAGSIPQAASVEIGPGSDRAPHDSNLRRFDLAIFSEAGAALEGSVEAHSITRAIESLVTREVWENHGGESTLSIVGNTLFVRANEQTQQGVSWMLASLRQDLDARREARAAAAAVTMRERERAITLLSAEMDERLKEIAELEARLNEITIEMHETRAIEIRSSGSIAGSPERIEYEARVARHRQLQSEASRWRIMLDDANAYRDAARRQLIELKHEPFVLAQREIERAAREQNLIRRANPTSSGVRIIDPGKD
jgi:prefoldin subunit 5